MSYELVYAGLMFVTPAASPTAAPFVVVAASWLLAAVAISLAALVSRRRAH